MRIHLAPMEGVVDHTMRAILTQVGGIDRCVTEFVRVVDQRLPPRVFYRLCPELRNGGLTPSGVPVFIQLLGGKAEFMAINAERAAALGAPGIDLNFGCPAKQVNRSDGGSIILREPERVHQIVKQVREAVPSAVPVTVKMRLGYDDKSLFNDVVGAIVSAGANEITIHARTKADGYKPPAYWSEINPVKQALNIPVYANGEIWTVADYHNCVLQSGCNHVMLGRGILSCPDLAKQIRHAMQAKDAHTEDTHATPLAWSRVVELLAQFSEITHEAYEPKYVGNRVKQWLGYLRRQYVLANDLFESVKRLRMAHDIAAAIESHYNTLPANVAGAGQAQ